MPQPYTFTLSCPRFCRAPMIAPPHRPHRAIPVSGYFARGFVMRRCGACILSRSCTASHVSSSIMAAAAWDGRVYVPGGATSDGFAAVATHDVLTP
jgi:hypothetical protein